MVVFNNYLTDTRVRREAEALLDRGDSVDVICLREKGQERTHVFKGARLYQVTTGKYRGSSGMLYLAQYLEFFVAASFLLAFLHLRRRYQVVQVHTLPDFMVFVAIVPKLLGARVVLDVHDLMPELYQSKFHLRDSHWLVRFITWIERRSIGFADRAIAVHIPHLDALVRHGNPGDKFIVLLNLPDPRLFSRQTTTERSRDACFRLTYHGTIAQRHGLRVGLRALSKVRDEIENMEFRIIGVGEDVQYLAELSRELGLTDCVRISESWVPAEELVPVVLASDLGLVPILKDDFTQYMLPTKLLEYVALGVPVICSRTATIEAYFDDSMVRYVEPGNVDGLAAEILDLYRNPEKRRALATSANRFNQEYNWEKMKQQYYQLIDALAGEARAQGQGRALVVSNGSQEDRRSQSL